MANPEQANVPRFIGLQSADMDPDSGDVTVVFVDANQVGYRAVLSRRCVSPLILTLQTRLAQAAPSGRTIEAQQYLCHEVSTFLDRELRPGLSFALDGNLARVYRAKQ